MTSKKEKLDQLEQRCRDELKHDPMWYVLDKDAQMVFGSGSPDASIFFIGEAPGANESKTGQPFIGQAGKLLDKHLQTIQQTREDVYIANVLKIRPSNNRDPTTDEIKRHAPYLFEQLAIIQPKVVVTLGNYSTRLILACGHTIQMRHIPEISKLHGWFFPFRLATTTMYIMPSFHPAALLHNRTPRLANVFTNDFQRLHLFISLDFKQISKLHITPPPIEEVHPATDEYPVDRFRILPIEKLCAKPKLNTDLPKWAYTSSASSSTTTQSSITQFFTE